MGGPPGPAMARRAGQLTMQFNVSGLLKEPTGATRRLEVDATITAPADACGLDSIWDRSSGIRVAGPVSMMRTDAGIWVRARLSCEVVCACSRCLAPHSQSTELSVDEEFYPRGQGPMLEEADETQLITPDNVLDLIPTMQQYAALAIPMSPLCAPRCAGMCQTCGSNLNAAACPCARSAADPRWEALAGLAAPRGGAGG